MATLWYIAYTTVYRQKIALLQLLSKDSLGNPAADEAASADWHSRETNSVCAFLDTGAGQQGFNREGRALLPRHPLLVVRTVRL